MEKQIGRPRNLQPKTILALNELGQAVTSSLRLEEVLQRVLVEVMEILDAEGVAILLPADDCLEFAAVRGHGAMHLRGKRLPLEAGVAGYVMRTGEAVWLNSETSSVPGLSIYRAVEAEDSFRTESLLAAPLRQGGVTIGVLEAAHGRADGLTIHDLPILDAAANWAAIAISNAQLHEQAQQAREQQALLEERARLARELHDAVTQSLYSMVVLAGAWKRQMDAGQLTPEKEQIGELGELAQQALREVRLLIYELRPTELEEEGLLGALYRRLEAVEQRAGVETRLLVTDEGGQNFPLPSGERSAMVDFYRLPWPVEQGLYRIAQEALNNALKHSMATQVCVCVRLGRSRLSLEVKDNGRGFDVDNHQVNGGFGLLSMAERAHNLGADFVIESSSSDGTAVRVEGVPYRYSDAAEMVS